MIVGGLRIGTMTLRYDWSCMADVMTIWLTLWLGCSADRRCASVMVGVLVKAEN